ncbi:MAG: Rne/Rng family ribonuclease [Planctomycetota bacterium]|nr:Rne/Rng family ribonuclease [Planctomycetota bacterium]
MAEKSSKSRQTKTMLINVSEPEESRIAIMHGSTLEELYVERKAEGKHLGNIYKGRVVNIEPSIQAAFIDFGARVNGFLHVSDLMPADSRNGRSSKRTEIQSILRRNQEVLVQVTKDAIGTKGPALTTYVSIPGRYLVLMPSLNKCGVSRKITDEDTRRRLKKMLQDLKPPADMGFIIRTAGIDRTKKDLERDLDYLLRLWKAVERRVAEEKAPATIYQESDLIIRTIRDIFDPEIGEILIDTPEATQKARDFMSAVAPRYRSRVKLYDDPRPIFHRDQLEEQIDQIYDKRVSLKSGGSIVIEQTEALVAIDVNSGKFKEEKDPEETAYKTNLEAASEIARQLRLRDLGGLIINDYIDMRDVRRRKGVERAFKEAMKNDRARVRLARMSPFCIIEMTRQRVGPSLRSSAYEPCPTCDGTGFIKTIESMGLKVLREIRLGLSGSDTVGVDAWVHRRVSDYVSNRKRRVLLDLEETSGKSITVNVGKHFGMEDFRIVFHRKGGYDATRTNMKQVAV